MLRTFNMGIGLILVVHAGARADADARGPVETRRELPVVIGAIVSRRDCELVCAHA